MFENNGCLGFAESRAAILGSYFDLDARAVCLVSKEGAGAEEAVTPEPFAAHDALEQERPVAFLNFAERGDGSERVADELAIDRNDTVPTGQLNELLER